MELGYRRTIIACINRFYKSYELNEQSNAHGSYQLNYLLRQIEWRYLAHFFQFPQ